MKITINAKTKSDQVEITFNDNGICISPKYIDQVFNIFTRSTKKSHGSGLGLHIVKQCIKSINGKIAVKSAENSYTIFTLSLPQLTNSTK